MRVGVQIGGRNRASGGSLDLTDINPVSGRIAEAGAMPAVSLPRHFDSGAE
jgi:hypothetical protein